MTKDMVKNIGLAESTTVEFKQSLSEMDDIIVAVAAFANTDGGRIYIGVSDQGEVIGLQIGKGTIENLANKIAQHTEPKIQPRITVKKINRKEIIIIEAKSSMDGLVLADGRPYKRVGKSSPKMGKDEYEGLILEKHKDKFQFDEMICKGAVVKDIDADKVHWFLAEAKKENRLTVPPNTPVKDALTRLKLLRGDKLTNAAILLFGKDPQYFFVQAKIRAARFKGTDKHDFIDMKVLEGTIPELREKALGFIAEHTRHAVFFDSNQRYDKWEYPGRALEEVLNNALAHRDYWASSDIHLAIYDNRIEVWNPGELPKQLTPAQLKKKHLSIPRNRFLADRLYYIKYIEHWGRGTNSIVDDMRKDKLPDPIFEPLSGGLNVILMGPGKSFEKAMDEEKLHKLDLNDRQKRAMEYIKKVGRITRPIYCQINDIGETFAKKEINDLIGKHIVRRVGGSKNTYYVLVTE